MLTDNENDPTLSEVIGEVIHLSGQTEVGFEIVLKYLDKYDLSEFRWIFNQVKSQRLDIQIAREIFSEAAEIGRPDAGWEDADSG